MKTFSQRKGIHPVSDKIQIDSMDANLRNSIWNTLDSEIWSQSGFKYSTNRTSVARIMPFSRTLWSDYFKKAADTRSSDKHEILVSFRSYYFKAQWNEVYDFLEFVVGYFNYRTSLIDRLNAVLERERSGYRFVSNHLTDIISHEEIQMLESALKDSIFSGVSAHLQRAFDLYTDRENPDYRNSIKESISAVESISRILSGSPKATLGDALKIIEQKNILHPALKSGFLKLYGYTSDAEGIRHSMLTDSTDISATDARYFLLSCTSFINYLKDKT